MSYGVLQTSNRSAFSSIQTGIVGLDFTGYGGRSRIADIMLSQNLQLLFSEKLRFGIIIPCL